MNILYTVDASVWINAFGKNEPGYRDSKRLLFRLATDAIPLVLPTLLLVEIAGSLSRRGTSLKRIDVTIERLLAVGLYADPSACQFESHFIMSLPITLRHVSTKMPKIIVNGVTRCAQISKGWR